MINSKTLQESKTETLNREPINFFVTAEMYSDIKGMVTDWFFSVSEFVRHAVFYTAIRFRGGKIQYRSFLDKYGVMTRKHFFKREAMFSRRLAVKFPPLLHEYIDCRSSELLDVDLYNDRDKGVSLFLRGCINYYLEECLSLEVL